MPGVTVRKTVGAGIPSSSAYVCDPDGYWLELMPRHKAPVYRQLGKTVLDGEWTEQPPNKIRGLLTGMQGLYRTMH